MWLCEPDGGAEHRPHRRHHAQLHAPPSGRPRRLARASTRRARASASTTRSAPDSATRAFRSCLLSSSKRAPATLRRLHSGQPSPKMCPDPSSTERWCPGSRASLPATASASAPLAQHERLLGEEPSGARSLAPRRAAERRRPGRWRTTRSRCPRSSVTSGRARMKKERGRHRQRDPVEDALRLVDRQMPDLGVVGVVELRAWPTGSIRGRVTSAQRGSFVPSTTVMAPTASRKVRTSAVKSRRRLSESLRAPAGRPKRPVFSGVPTLRAVAWYLQAAPGRIHCIPDPGRVPHEIRRVVEYRSAARMSCHPPDASPPKGTSVAPLFALRRSGGALTCLGALGAGPAGQRDRRRGPSHPWRMENPHRVERTFADLQAAGVRWARVDLRWLLYRSPRVRLWPRAEPIGARWTRSWPPRIGMA